MWVTGVVGQVTSEEHVTRVTDPEPSPRATCGHNREETGPSAQRIGLINVAKVTF